MTLLTSSDSVKFWPEQDVVGLPFQLPILRGDKGEQRSPFPGGELPAWSLVERSLWLSRSGYLLFNERADGRQTIELLCDRLLICADVDRRRGAPRLWLSGGGRGIRFGGNYERRRFLAHGQPVHHEGVWVGPVNEFRTRFESDARFRSGRYVERIIEQLAESKAQPTREATVAAQHRAPSSAQEVALLHSLELICDAEYELEQRAAQLDAGYHFYAARSEPRRSTVKRYFRLSLVEADHQRLLEDGTAAKALCLEEAPGKRLLLEVEDMNPAPGTSEIIVSSPRQTTNEDVPSAGELKRAASPKQYEARKKALASLRAGVSQNAWLVPAAAGTFSPSLFAVQPIAPKAGGFAPNPSQLDAIAKGMGTPDYALVLGPPGTGKTTVIYSWVEQLVAQGKRVLITSQGNRAVDNVLERVARDKSFTCVRLGNESKLTASMRDLLLDNCATELQRSIISTIEERFSALRAVFASYERVMQALSADAPPNVVAEDLRACRDSIERELVPLREALGLTDGSAWDTRSRELERAASNTGRQLALAAEHSARTGWLRLFHKLKAFFHRRRAASLDKVFETARTDLKTLAQGQHERIQQIERIVREWHQLLTGQRQQGLYPLLLRLIDVVGATCIGIDTNRYFGDTEFDVVIVDEAGQIQLHNLVVPMAKGAKVILVGDHNQLPPVVNEELLDELRARSELEEAPVDALIEKSWFEIMWERAPEERKAMLDTQFRCPSVISDFISEAFYGNRYFAGEPMKQKTPLVPELKSTMVFIDTSDLPPADRYEQKQDRVFQGNRSESAIVLGVLEFFAERVPELLEKNEVGIIVPLKNHVRELQAEVARLKGRGRLQGLSTPPSELVATVDSYQGQERDLIIYASGRSNRAGAVGFLKDWRRLNVAMTRAKRQLVMVGDLSTLARPAEYPADDEVFKASMQVLIRHLEERCQLISASQWRRMARARA